MIRLLFGILLLAHGLIHAAIWLPPKTEKSPFDPKHSWLLSGLHLPAGFIRIFAIIISSVAALTLMSGGIGLLTHQSWWLISMLIGAINSLFLILVYFNPWLSFAVLLDIGVIYLLAIRHWIVE